MKQQVLNLKVSGLYTNPNQFSEIPQGALSIAENVVIDKGSVIESRRGFEKYGTALSDIDSIHDYQDKLIVNYDTSLAYDSDGSGTWVNYSGSYEPPSGFKMRSVKQSSNFYFTTDAGIKKLSSISGTVASAGVPKCLDGEISLSGTTGGWLSNNHTVAYRMVLGIQDTNNNLILGSPSGRAIVNNSLSGTRSTTVKFYIPSGLSTSYFYQVYRSATTSSASITPNDELQLVYENNLTSSDITNGYIQFNDIRPDSLKGAFLYTNAGQEGILQSNDQPPLACDICNYKQMVFFANTTTKQRKIFTLIGTTATTGTVGSLSSGDTITIGGVVYTGGAAENVATRTFQVFTSGTPSANIENTCFSLLRVINQTTSNTTYYGYYISGYNDLPGQMLIEERGIGGNAITFTSSNGSAFNPVIPSSGTSYTTDNEETQNRVYYSKQGQPEAVPIVNYFNLGSKDFPIQRIVPLRDSIFVFKEDGIFRILGEDPTSLRTQIFDNTATIIGANTAVELANTIYLYSDQGVVSCSDNGVSIMSLPIEDQLFQLEVLTGFVSTAHAVSYESDRKYIFFTKTLAGDATATQAWVYNQVTNAWTKWLLTATCGYVFDAKMYFGGANGYVYKERKSYSISDYKDEDYDVTITGVTGSDITITGSSVAEVVVGNILYKSGLDSYISEVSGSGSTRVLTVEDTGFTTGSAVVYSTIPCLVEWAQESAQNPGILKHFREVTLLMRNSEFKTLEIGFTSSLDTNAEYVEIEPELEGQWGSFPWGSIPWGGGLISRPVPIRTYVPLSKSRASWMFLRVRSNKSESNFAIAGASIIFTPMSERFNG